MPLRPKFLSVSLYDDQLASDGAQFSEKYTDTKWYSYTYIICSRGSNICLFHLKMIRVCTMAQFWEKCPMQKTQKWPWHVQSQKYPCAYLICPVNFTLWWAAFGLQTNLEKSAQNDPKMTLTSSRSKVPKCLPHTPEAQSYVSFTLRWPIFELHPNSEISVLNDPKCPPPPTCSRSKLSMLLPYTLTSPKFLFVSLYDEKFSSLIYMPQFWENEQMTQNNLDMLEVKSIHMLTLYAPYVHIFVHFTLPWAIFKLRSNFEQNALNDPKITLTNSRSNVPMFRHDMPLRNKFCSAMSHFQGKKESFKFPIEYKIKIKFKLPSLAKY